MEDGLSGIEIRITIVNAKAVEAFDEAMNILREMSEDQPWNETLRFVLELMTEAAEGMDIDET